MKVNNNKKLQREQVIKIVNAAKEATTMKVIVDIIGGLYPHSVDDQIRTLRIIADNLEEELKNQ